MHLPFAQRLPCTARPGAAGCPLLALRRSGPYVELKGQRYTIEIADRLTPRARMA